MEPQASVLAPPHENTAAAATSAVGSPSIKVTRSPNPDVKPTTVPRAQNSATSILTAADMDRILLSLTPARDNATGSRADSLVVVPRANSDPTLRSPASLPSKLTPQTGHNPKRRHSLGIAKLGKRTALEEKRKDGFLDVFGLLGIPMVLAFLFSGSAVMVQAFIQVYPNKFANTLMGTTNYDDGDFWLLPETDMAPKVIATLLLVFFACCYYALAIFMLFFRHKVTAHVKKNKHPAEHHVVPEKNEDGKTKSDDLSKIKSQFASQKARASFAVADVYEKFASIDSPYHAYYVS